MEYPVEETALAGAVVALDAGGPDAGKVDLGVLVGHHITEF